MHVTDFMFAGVQSHFLRSGRRTPAAAASASARARMGVFMAATRQHVGKSTTSLGLLDALLRRVVALIAHTANRQLFAALGGKRLRVKLNAVNWVVTVLYAHQLKFTRCLPAAALSKVVGGECTYCGGHF